MIPYLVLTPPGMAATEARARFIGDRRAWLAFFLPGPWLLFQRQWLAGIAVVLLQTVPTAIVSQAMGETLQTMLAGALLNIALGLLVCLEGPLFVARSLIGSGWTLRDIIPAPDIGLAETIHVQRVAAAIPPSPHPSLAPAIDATGSGRFDLFGSYGDR